VEAIEIQLPFPTETQISFVIITANNNWAFSK
jgi:hypothetical protein